jgi:hypothetical protein
VRPNRKLIVGAVLLLSCGLIATGCGGDDDSSDTDAAGTGATTQAPTSAEEVDEAVDESLESAREDIEQCREEAEALDEGPTRDTAIELCEQAEEALEAAGG